MRYEATIRRATSADLPALRDLLGARARSGSLPALLARERGRFLLVLDGPRCELAAAALLQIDGARAHLELLAIADSGDAAEIEARLLGVVEGLCAAYGARIFDVPARQVA